MARPLPPAPLLGAGPGYGAAWNSPARFARGFAQGDLVEINEMREAINQLDPTMSIPYEGEDDSRWKWNQKQQLMAERDRLQQLLQRPEEITDEEIQEIQMQIREITKELDMDMRMAGGGLASLRGGGRTMNPRAAGAAALRRRFPQPMQRLMPGQPGVSADDPRLQWQVGGPGGG